MWKLVKDENVRSCWQCEDCGGVLGDITPDWYEQNGTPVCPECDRDMSYDYTEVNVDG
jgi:ABC-type ATPase with predicted acetyltransferase domain